MADVAGFSPTHMAPPTGLQAWVGPDPSQPTASIDAGLEVQVAERRDDWARIVCSNGWSAWVDGRLLINVAAARSKATAVIDLLDAAMKEYERAVEDAAAHRIDQAEFQRRAFRAGLVVSDNDAWLLDLANQRWCRYDGFGLETLPVGRR